MTYHIYSSKDAYASAELKYSEELSKRNTHILKHNFTPKFYSSLCVILFLPSIDIKVLHKRDQSY